METLIIFGGSVKALGAGKIGGYLISYGDAATPDTSPERDFFTPSTDFAVEAWPARTLTYYNHGLDVKVGKRRLPSGTMKTDDLGVWVETQLALRDEWEQAVYALAEAGKLSWSSGTASHLVERKAVEKDGRTVAHQVLQWPLGLDASLTPTPAEPRCAALALKSWAESSPALEFPTTLLRGDSLVGDTERVQVALLDLTGAYESLAAKSGRALSRARRERLTGLHGQLTEVLSAMEVLLAETEPKEEAQGVLSSSAPPPAMGRQETVALVDAEAARRDTDRLRTEFLRYQSRVPLGASA